MSLSPPRADDARLLAAAADYRLTDWLAARAAAAHLVAPPALLAAAQAACGDAPPAWTASTDLDGVRPGAKRLFVHHPHDEAGLIDAARRRFPAAEVLGLMHHVVPRLACSPGGRQGRLDARHVGAPSQCYAVVCTPRTGSTFLCELLQAGGLGAPREHLRSALAHVLRAPGVDTAQVLDEVMAWGQAGGLFGTKLISHFLDDTVGPHATADTLGCLARQGWRFVHLDRDPAEQAVSKYVAARTDLWHVRGRIDAVHLARVAQVPFDADALRAMFATVCRERQRLADALATLPPGCVLPLDYGDITADPQAALARVAAHLGRAAPPPVSLDRLPLRMSAQAPEMGRMARWLRGESPAP